MSTRWEVERAVCASDLTPQERLIVLTLLTLADQDSATIPDGFTPSLTRIQSMTGQGATTVKRGLNALEQAGWVVRNRPDVARARAEKERTRYALKVPVTRSAQGLETRSAQGLARPKEGLGLGPHRAPGLGPQRATSHTALHTDQNQQASPTSPEERVREATGATAAEATAIVKKIREERNPRSLDGFIRHLAASGDLGQYLTDVRAIAARYADDNDRKLRRGRPPCEHGSFGGNEPHSVTGELRCRACRTRQAATHLNGTARIIPIRTQEVS